MVAKDENGTVIHNFESAGEAQTLLGFNRGSTRDAVTGKLKTYKGLYWYNERAKEEKK